MKALTYVQLGEVRKNPGDKVTKTELKEAGQTDEDVKHLIKTGVLSEDDKAEVHESHKEVEVEGTVTDADGGTSVEQAN
jgi:chitodextrinase